MVNNKNIYVSIETAILLKNAGFDIECHTRIPYNINAYDNSCSGYYEDCKYAKNWNADSNSLSVPTLDIVIDWVKNKYGVTAVSEKDIQKLLKINNV